MVAKKIFKRDSCKWFTDADFSGLPWCKNRKMKLPAARQDAAGWTPMPLALDCATECEFYEEVE